MAGIITEMSKIKQLIKLHESGESNRQIARTLSMDRGTVGNYIRKIESGNMDTDELMNLEEPVLEGKFIAGTAAYTDARFEAFREMLPYFEQELKRKHVTRSLLWQEYLMKHPFGYRYTQFCYHLGQQFAARKPSAVLVHEAGRELYVDFCGDKLEYVDMETGEIIPVHVFIACLPFSDYTFIMAVRQQTAEDFLHALACCLHHLGGSPQILVPDNLKAAVIKADSYEPKLNRIMEDFANHYGFGIIPARPAHPRDKAKAENAVRIIYSRVYAKLRNMRFFSLEELNKALLEKTMEHNQTRMQRADYSRQERFLAGEKHLLQPLPETAFEIKYYTDLHVSQDNHVYLGRDRHYYSVPYVHTGKKVQVIYTRTIVRIYCDNEKVATHPRIIGFGYSTNPDHLCSTHRHYMNRSPVYFVEMARQKSAALAMLMTAMFDRPQAPELSYRTCDGLLSLCRKTDLPVFEKACQTALENRVFSIAFIKSLIERKILSVEPETCRPIPAPREYTRGKDYYK